MEGISYGSYEFTLAARERLVLPAYKGSTLRGGFGHAFRRVVCAPRKPVCDGCFLKGSCVYSYVFETPPPSGSSMMRKYEAAPHPFVIEPSVDRRRQYEPGQELTFNLLLIGRAVEYLAYFIYAFSELGEIGIGKKLGKFELRSVTSGGIMVYDAETRQVRNAEPRKLTLDLAAAPEIVSAPMHLSVDFLTPTRIFYNKQLAATPEFHVLIRAILRRMSLLHYFHCGGDPSGWDFRGIIERAGAVEMKRNGTKWHDWERYSSRQDTRMTLGGFMGDVEYEGDIAPFLPLIRAGEALHVGKGTGFGLGRFGVG
ncbi:MAG: CRISPR system precrRNA processing endoribonuclease RAMP protein Cas6 [Nitrospirae bacterium]|nr:CRISPR system precrRNA processing endoribonuclease RAMP protein Cas6 [Nitrospirota bacterium]